MSSSSASSSSVVPSIARVVTSAEDIGQGIVGLKDEDRKDMVELCMRCQDLKDQRKYDEIQRLITESTCDNDGLLHTDANKHYYKLITMEYKVWDDKRKQEQEAKRKQEEAKLKADKAYMDEIFGCMGIVGEESGKESEEGKEKRGKKRKAEEGTERKEKKKEGKEKKKEKKEGKEKKEKKESKQKQEEKAKKKAEREQARAERETKRLEEMKKEKVMLKSAEKQEIVNELRLLGQSDVKLMQYVVDNVMVEEKKEEKKGEDGKEAKEKKEFEIIDAQSEEEMIKTYPYTYQAFCRLNAGAVWNLRILLMESTRLMTWMKAVQADEKAFTAMRQMSKHNPISFLQFFMPPSLQDKKYLQSNKQLNPWQYNFGNCAKLRLLSRINLWCPLSGLKDADKQDLKTLSRFSCRCTTVVNESRDGKDQGVSGYKASGSDAYPLSAIFYAMNHRKEANLPEREIPARGLPSTPFGAVHRLFTAFEQFLQAVSSNEQDGKEVKAQAQDSFPSFVGASIRQFHVPAWGGVDESKCEQEMAYADASLQQKMVFFEVRHILEFALARTGIHDPSQVLLKARKSRKVVKPEEAKAAAKPSLESDESKSIFLSRLQVEAKGKAKANAHLCATIASVQLCPSLCGGRLPLPFVQRQMRLAYKGVIEDTTGDKKYIPLSKVADMLEDQHKRGLYLASWWTSVLHQEALKVLPAMPDVKHKKKKEEAEEDTDSETEEEKEEEEPALKRVRIHEPEVTAVQPVPNRDQIKLMDLAA